MTKLKTAAVALAGILAVTATSATSASAQWRGHRGGHWGPGIGIGAGIAAGALIGAAVASRPYYGGYYYDDPGYVYAQPYGYAAPYAYDAGPGYYGYGWDRGGNYGWSRCTTDEGYGRRTDCGASSR